MSRVDPLTPWADGPAGGAPLERRIADLFAAVPEPAPVPDLARQRVALRLRSRTKRGAGLTLLRLIVVGVGVGIAGAAAAQWATTHWFIAQRPLEMPRSRVVVNPALAPQPSLPHAPARPESAVPEASAVEPVAPAPPLPAPVQSSRLGLEAASLEAALSMLRAGGKGAAALALSRVDQHLLNFPGGPLELEARVARIDALLLLGRRQEAKRELSILPIENVGRSRELRLIRAELRADDDCKAALADFRVLIEQNPAPAWLERALFGRGACLLRLGDDAAAERDFDRYLEQFPSGRFAEQIRAQRGR